MTKHFNIYYIFCLALLFGFLQLINVEASQYRRFDVVDDLPIKDAQDIVKDSCGLIWVAHTGGALRYDGYEVVEYGEKDSERFPLETVWRLFVNTTGQLWLAGGNSGCARYDYATERFFHYPYVENDSVKILRHVRDFYEDKNNRLWIGAKGGLFYYEPERDMVLRAENFHLEDEHSEAYAIVEDDENNLWIGTDFGNIYLYNLTSKKTTRYASGHFKEQCESINHIRDLLFDSKGYIWVVGQGIVMRINPKTNEQTRINDILLDTQIATCIDEDKEGNFWISSSGLSILSPELKKIEYYAEDESGTSLNCLSATHLYRDNQNLTWIGSWFGGLNITNERKNSIKIHTYHGGAANTLSHNVIHTIFEDKQHKIWLGNGKGTLDKLDPTTKTFTRYKDPGMITSEPVSSIINGYNKDELLIGSWGCLKSLNTNTGKFKRLKQNMNFSRLCEKNDSTAFITISNSGLFELHLADNLISNPTENIKNNCIRLIYYTRQLYLEDHKQLWVVLWAGLVKYDLDSNCFEVFHQNSDDPLALPEGQIFCCYKDHKKRFWIGHIKGISLYQPETNSFISFGKAQGIAGQKVKSILEDDAGNLWLATDKGISQFTLPAFALEITRDSSYLSSLPEDFKYFHNYTSEDGTIDGEFLSASLRASDGTMYFGGVGGINAINPENMKPDTIHSPIRFIELRVFNKKINPKETGSPLKKSINITKTITLQHDQYFFTIKWAALNYYATKKVEYAYQLEGFDKKWNHIGQQRTASFTGLPAGKYTLKVKATNADGRWNQEEARINICILPAWWETWWFRIFAGFFIIGMITLIIYRRFRLLERQKKILQEKVSERTKELEEADATKDKFFSIIAHDLRNPFQTLLGYSELLPLVYKEYKERDLLNLFDKIHEVSKKTFDLLENLLTWSLNQSGKIKYHATNICVKDYIEENVLLSESIAHAKAIKIYHNVNPHHQVWADRNTCDVIIRNLLSNAIKFTDRGGEIHVFSQKLSKNNKAYIQISVKDTGIGMDSHALNSIFTSAKVNSMAGTEKETGTGIGLVLCKEFIERNKGQIWAESELGKGSTFYFTIPMHIDN